MISFNKSTCAVCSNLGVYEEIMLVWQWIIYPKEKWTWKAKAEIEWSEYLWQPSQGNNYEIAFLQANFEATD